MKTAPLPVPVVATEGVYLELADGRRLIDGMSSWWTACHGYNHPHIVAAVRRQLEVMPHVMFGGIHHRPALELARRLAELLPGDLNRVFFSDSGSVSVEVALKMAVQYWLNRGQPRRHRFLSFHYGYHGDTVATMAIGDPINGMHARWREFLPRHWSRPLPAEDESGEPLAEELEALERFLVQHREQLAGIVVEPLIQGAGGMRFHSVQTLRALREACDRHELLLIADEIATGFARTGSMFACEQAGVVPDIVCLSKALTGGTLPLAATVAREQVFAGFWSDNPEDALMHGPTYMANPLGCAAANASLDLFEQEPRCEQARVLEVKLAELLAPCRALPGVVDVRTRGGVGVVQVAELKQLDRLRAALVEAGIWLRPFRDVIYTTPPLVIEDPELTRLGEAMCQVIRDWASW